MNYKKVETDVVCECVNFFCTNSSRAILFYMGFCRCWIYKVARIVGKSCVKSTEKLSRIYNTRHNNNISLHREPSTLSSSIIAQLIQKMLYPNQ